MFSTKSNFLTEILMKKILLLSLIFTMISSAQWISDPAQNLKICDFSGEQALAKISVTSDGGNYISWFDNRNGSYAVYLQRLDKLGNKMWDENGLLVSGNPQSSSLVDYDLKTDNNDNAIVTFTDTRNSGALNVFVYKISPSGTFLWGENGIGLSTTTDFQANPKIAILDDGNITIAWIIASSGYVTAVQKLSPEGAKLWGEMPVLVQSSAEGYNHPYPVPTDSNGVLIIHTGVTGNFPAQTVKIRASKLSASGSVSWRKNIQNIGTIAAFTVPLVYSDHNHGAIVAWHDDRDANNLQSGFVQRIHPNGEIAFPENGVELSSLPNSHKFNPVVSFDPVTEEIYSYWLATEPNQNQNGISGQKLNSFGDKMWGDNGKTLKPLSSPFALSISSLNSEFAAGKSVLAYIESAASGINSKVYSFAVDGSGNFLWTGDFVLVSDLSQEKLQMESTVDIFGNVELVWGDKRLSDRGIYAQNINPAGFLGDPEIPVELTSFTAFVNDGIITLQWETATETNNQGFQIERSLSGAEGWGVIGYVEGKGTTTEKQSYSYADYNPLPGNSFYRLHQIDFDGSSEYSEPVKVESLSPVQYSLAQNYPNPFNPATTIKFSLPENSNVSLRVFNALGEEVANLINKEMEAGYHQVNFNTGAYGLSSGIYFYRIESGSFVSVRKMILMK